MRKPAFSICKNKDADQLRGGFATRIVQSLYFLNLKFQASSHLVWLYSLVCVGPGWKPRRLVFSQRSSYIFLSWATLLMSYVPSQINSKSTAARSHYANAPMQYTVIFHSCKNDNFQIKNCNIFAQNKDRGYMLEPPQ